MERNVLVDEIANFCFEYGVINSGVDESELKSIICNHLNEEEFIENIINTIITKTRTRGDIDTGKLIALLMELEKIRLELEYKDNEAL